MFMKIVQIFELYPLFWYFDLIVMVEAVFLESVFFFFFQAEDGIRDTSVTGVQTCALPICPRSSPPKKGLLFCSSSLSEARRLGLQNNNPFFGGELRGRF